ncbi:uncharacterized protein V6R79_016851, partial [Siganus canaliculatus]
TSNIVRHGKDAALRGLPVFLLEEPKDFFRQCIILSLLMMLQVDKAGATTHVQLHKQCAPAPSGRLVTDLAGMSRDDDMVYQQVREGVFICVCARDQNGPVIVPFKCSLEPVLVYLWRRGTVKAQ